MKCIDFEKKYHEIKNNLEKVPKTMFWFHLATWTRILVPIILFRKVNPFWAILINELILDFFISPHHFVINTMPMEKRYLANHYYSDKPLDTWGFFMALQPVVDKTNKYYEIFDGYRDLMYYLFIFRLIGYIIFCKVKCKQVFIIFANLYMTTYTIISFFRTYLPGASNEIINRVIFLGFLYTFIKEYNLHSKSLSEYDNEFSL
jgi:hypothetical protein